MKNWVRKDYNGTTLGLALLLIALGVGARILPHPPNFTPIAAVALFGGMYLSARLSFVIPLAAMAVSDIFIGFYTLPIMLSVYGSFLISVVIGRNVRRAKRPLVIAGGTIMSSLIFFLITNGAVWAFGTMYPHTAAGLMQSYLMGLPFFKNTLLGDIFYVSILVGTYEALRFALKRRFVAVKI